jgi:membrane protease YdiL (CAAX protease family)
MPAVPGLPTIADHVFVVLLVVGVPVYAALFSWPRMKRLKLADASPHARTRYYLGELGWQWVLAALAVATWVYGGRSGEDFGFTLPWGPRLWMGVGAAAVVAIGLTVQYGLALRSAESRVKVRDELRAVAPFAPQTPGEMGPFALLAITAGICEEILFRGFLIWYVSMFTGVSIWGLALAVVVSAVAFAVAHLYQGVMGAVRVVGAALVFGTLYVVCESLWPVMLLHAYVDLAGGYLALKVHRRNQEK